MAIPVGLQLYSIRQDCTKDLAGSLAAVARMGYRGVEFYSYYDRPAGELRKMLDGLGLVCCGTHTGLATLTGDALAATIEFNKALGNRYLILPSMPKDRRTPDRALWLDNAATLNRIAEQLRPHGMAVGYHAHKIDFERADGQYLWDILAANTGPDVVLQADTGNMMSAGADPVEYLKRYPGRARTVHLKGFARPDQWRFVGDGDVDWPAVFSVCETAGRTEWYIVEQENYPVSPLDSARQCRENLRRLGR